MKRLPIISIFLVLFLAACGTTSVFELKVGDCFNEPSGDVVSDVVAVECSTLHDYEIFGAVDHPASSGEAYPGAADIEAVVNTECEALFEPFVGTPYGDSALFIYFLAPGEESWADGDREILCALFMSEQQLEGSMEGSEI